ncbi:hypothetical protein D3C84_1156790 [compost metagenome]
MKDEKRQRVDRGIAEHVQGVSQQGSGPGDPASAELHEEHQGIDDQDDVKHATLPGTQLCQFPGLVFAAAIHDPILVSDVLDIE